MWAQTYTKGKEECIFQQKKAGAKKGADDNTQGMTKKVLQSGQPPPRCASTLKVRKRRSDGVPCLGLLRRSARVTGGAHGILPNPTYGPVCRPLIVADLDLGTVAATTAMPIRSSSEAGAHAMSWAMNHRSILQHEL